MLYQSIAGALTSITGGRIDFFNIGGLALQRTQDSFLGLWTHYSWREYFIRGGILATTTLVGYLGAQSCEEEDEYCSPILRGLFGAGLGFFASHSLAMVSTIQRRNTIIANIANMNDTLTVTLLTLKGTPLRSAPLQTFLDNMSEMQRKIMDFQAPLEKKGDAVRGLVMKKQALQELINRFEHDLQRLLDTQDEREVLEVLENINADWDDRYSLSDVSCLNAA